MRISLTILLIIGSMQFAFSQYNPDSEDEPKIKRYYKLSDVSLHYSGAIFDFSSTYLNHIHEISSFETPSWSNMDSIIKLGNRSEIYTRLNFQKQLGGQESSFYGNFSVGLSLSNGSRLNALYISEEKIKYDSATFNSEPVTKLDSTIIFQNNYDYSSTEIGLDIMYTISTPPKPTLKGELGIGLTTFYTISDNFVYVESKAVNTYFMDQFSRNQSFTEIEKVDNKLSTQPQLVLKLYIPLILSYKLSHRGDFALSTMISGGVEFQKPKSGNFYAYPFFTIGIGCKYYF